jgi:predicted flap endonuclease-1-like 5' DNA nuclease
MPEITVVHIALLAVAAVAGAVAAWFIRGNRSEQEKAAISLGWQERIDAQRKEHDRLVVQNKGLMEQVSQFQASHTDAKNRAKELSIAVQEAFERRDELQREIKDIRSNLEVAVNERKQLQSDIEASSVGEDILRQKDERIDKLNRELVNWQNRLPPLIERFRVRNEEAEQVERELAEARDRIQELETAQDQAEDEQTRIEAVHDPDDLTDGLDASNDPVDDMTPEPEDEDEEVEDLEENEEPEEDEQEAENLAEDEEEAEDPEEIEEEEEDQEQPGSDFDAETELDPYAQRDNLKKIKGVGPAIEKTLNEIGIFSFQQIADMSEYDIDRVAKRLKGFHGSTRDETKLNPNQLPTRRLGRLCSRSPGAEGRLSWRETLPQVATKNSSAKSRLRDFPEQSCTQTSTRWVSHPTGGFRQRPNFSRRCRHCSHPLQC